MCGPRTQFAAAVRDAAGCHCRCTVPPVLTDPECSGMLERPCFPAALTCPPRAQVRDPIALIVSSFLYHSNPKNSRTSSYEHWLRVPHTERHDATESVCNKALGGDSRGLGCPLQFKYELPLGTLALLEGDFEAPAIASVPNQKDSADPGGIVAESSFPSLSSRTVSLVYS